MYRMQSGGWLYSEDGRDSSKTPSLRVAFLRLTHSQECQPSERFSMIGRTGSGRQASRQRPAEELGEEGEEEEKVRLVYFTISKISSCKQLLCVWCRGREQ